MHPLAFRLTPLALLLACTIGPALATESATGRQAELAAARADLQAAARRVAELSAHGIASSSRTIQLGTGRPRLGVLLEADRKDGVRISGVTPGSGAEEAGLKTGDRLLKIGGTSITGAHAEARVDAARDLLSDLSRDRPLRLTYERDGRRHEVEATPRISGPLVIGRAHAQPASAAALALVDGQPLDLEGLAPRISGEVLRFSRGAGCDSGDCGSPLLIEALRWNGLNLTALNPQLGRYFGTDSGVLILSQGTLPDLQAGDVIREIDGKAVSSPHEAMRAISARPPGQQSRVRLMRDKRSQEVLVTVPDRMPSLGGFMPPPAPPAPTAPPAPSAPAAPPAPRHAPTPPAPPPAPAAAEGSRIQVFA